MAIKSQKVEVRKQILRAILRSTKSVIILLTNIK